MEREVAEHVSEPEYEPESYERDLYLQSVAYDTEPVMVPVVYDAQPMMVPVTGIYDIEPEMVPETCGSQHVMVPVIHDSQPVTTTSYNFESHSMTTVSVTNQQPTTTVLPMYDSQSTVTHSSEPELAARLVFESEPVVESAPCEPTSEMYYTASSEVSLLSDMDLQERAQSEDSDRDGRNSVMAGHVAAMRERFESMTRTNTPCPDLIRSASPSFEVFRNISTSPDVEKS